MTRPVDPWKPFEAPDKCTAKTQAGKPCGRAPSSGTTVCQVHGGAAPRVKRTAAKRKAVVEWMKLYGAPVADADPNEVVLSQIRWAAGHVNGLRSAVQALDNAPLTDADAAALLNAYDSERDRLVRMASIAARIGIDERAVQLAEQVGTVVVTVLHGLMDDLQLTPAQRSLAMAALPGRLSSISSALQESS